MTTCPDVAVCAGKDCSRDERKRWKHLTATLEGTEVVRTKCLDICKGPVVVVAPASERPVVVKKVKRPHAERIRRHVDEGTDPANDDELRVVTKEKKRRKAVSRARRALD